MADWLESHQHIVDEKGHRQVVGNGRLPARTITTGVGPVDRQALSDVLGVLRATNFRHAEAPAC